MHNVLAGNLNKSEFGTSKQQSKYIYLKKGAY